MNKSKSFKLVGAAKGRSTERGLINGRPTGKIKSLDDCCPMQPFEEHKKLSTISLGQTASNEGK